MITGIHHVSFCVRDMDRSIAFYREGLGFEPFSDRTIQGPVPEKVIQLEGAHLRLVHLRGHGIGLELIQYFAPAGRPVAPRPCDVGSAHLCFVVDDIDAEMERLERHGARFLSEAMTVEGGPNAGNRYVYFVDHDHIPMELSQPRKS
ncbi:MAG: putative lyase [candidate division BRC1 bacterium ADurb.BinA292]|nr:MAG: putative lyase [candidate division BRC1 bacterium ADurb.BinA292]